MIQNTIDFQFFSPIQFNKKFNKKFWDKIQFNKIFNKKILDKIQFKTLFNSKKLNSKNYSISKISRIFNSKFDSKCWNWQDSIQQYIHSIRKRGYRSPLFSNGFVTFRPSPLNVFFPGTPLETMVFWWFSKFWVQWLSMIKIMEKGQYCRFSDFWNSPTVLVFSYFGI